MKPIETLKKGLAKLRHQIRDRKTRLEGELKAHQPVSDSNLEWLDNAGNLVDEERVVDALDHASDYERGLQRLNSHDKSVIEKLKNLAGSGDHEKPANKRKRMAFLNLMIYAKSNCRS
ncbi:hypothetical protein PAXRUDRAFT_164834 [Paxillus rubicundulus Ve08.2h10]|uniref:Uncharacterized protein n=1 Tax=Paxillus rubicundulus Ve08.2h10 TaxID=930991 RepID=A0A0D0DJ24_9AGAM|nr:hypothetical protein PAXRUDRAFT_164834 [Paxillus rubicundulus Ve08.2h10]